MKNDKTVIEAADLFCGAGGSSTGLVNAVKSLKMKVQLLAINHWEVAIATHSQNHKAVDHLCAAINSISPLAVIPSGRLKLLIASPECTHHSNARGGKPRSEQKRADAWELLRWIEELYVENLLIENVKEFQNWGPLNAKGLPDKRYRGLYFQRFIETLKVNYNVDVRVLNAADYGDATTRERLFIIARRPKHIQIVWPEQSHASLKEIEKAKKQPKLFGDARKLQTWRAAREIIDWSLQGESIFNRKRPLSPNTLKRIFAGLFKYSLKPFVVGAGGPIGAGQPKGVDEPLGTILNQNHRALIEPFLLNMKGTTRRARSIDQPTFTQCTSPTQQYLVEPFIVNMKGQSKARDIDSPLFTQTTQQHQYLAEPFIFNLEHSTGEGGGGHERYCRALDNPMMTVTGRAAIGLIEPFIVPCNHGNGDTRSHSVEDPMPTITSVDAWALLQPYLIKYFTGSDAASVEEPLPTVTANYEHLGLAQPFLVEYHGNHNGKEDGDRRTRSVDEPLGTQDTSNRYALAMPYLVKFYGNGENTQSINDPLATVTSKDRFGLCIPHIGAILDIHFRMLQPHELAAAMSFPKSYSFVGTRDQKVRQIGNAVPVRLAEALCRSLLKPEKKERRRKVA